MSRTLTAHVSLWDESGTVVTLAPGDELPEWAEGSVGEHCLAPDLEPNDVEEESDGAASEDEESTPDDSDTGGETEEVHTDDADDPKPEAKSKATDTPDFTSSAPRRRQSRK